MFLFLGFSPFFIFSLRQVLWTFDHVHTLIYEKRCICEWLLVWWIPHISNGQKNCKITTLEMSWSWNINYAKIDSMFKMWLVAVGHHIWVCSIWHREDISWVHCRNSSLKLILSQTWHILHLIVNFCIYMSSDGSWIEPYSPYVYACIYERVGV